MDPALRRDLMMLDLNGGPSLQPTLLFTNEAPPLMVDVFSSIADSTSPTSPTSPPPTGMI